MVQKERTPSMCGKLETPRRKWLEYCDGGHHDGKRWGSAIRGAARFERYFMSIGRGAEMSAGEIGRHKQGRKK